MIKADVFDMHPLSHAPSELLMVISFEQPEHPQSERLTKAVLQTVVDSWKSLFSSFATLKRRFYLGLAIARGAELSDPDNCDQIRYELLHDRNTEVPLTEERLLKSERQFVVMERISSLWCVVWSHLVPLFIVLFWAFKRIPEVIAESGWPVGVIFVALTAIAYVMLTCVLFVASAFLAIPFYRLMAWMLGIEFGPANAVNATSTKVNEQEL